MEYSQFAINSQGVLFLDFRNQATFVTGVLYHRGKLYLMNYYYVPSKNKK